MLTYCLSFQQENVTSQSHRGNGQVDAYSHRQCGQMQAETLSAGMQEILPSCANGQTLHRGDTEHEDRLNIRGIMHRLRYLR